MIKFNKDSSNNNNFNLSQNLRALRKRMKWSQEELADKLGLNRGNIASYESGTAEPKICNLVNVARLFKISIFDLTHSNLIEDAVYTKAIDRQENGSGNPLFPALKQYAAEAKEFESAIKGLECIFNMKMRNTGDLPEEMAFFKNQYEQLNNVARHLLNSHLELVATLKSNCPEHRKKMQAEAAAKTFKA